MHTSVVLAGIALGAALMVMLVDSLLTSLRHRAKAKELGCKPLVKTPSLDPSGIWALYLGFKASKAKRFPDFMQELYNRFQEGQRRPVSTLGLVSPFFKRVIFTAEPRNIQTMLALKFKDFGLGVNRTENFAPLLGNGIVSFFFFFLLFCLRARQHEHAAS